MRDTAPDSLQGDRISVSDGKLAVPDCPIVPFVRGDGVGPDLWESSRPVFDSAVERAYGGSRRIAWLEVFAGDMAREKFGKRLPDETVATFQKHLVGIKGPLARAPGSGILSLNFALRQVLDLYVCLRPARHFPGTPAPAKSPEKVDAIVFREGTEDFCAGIEFKADAEESRALRKYLKSELPESFDRIQFGSRQKVRTWQAAAGLPEDLYGSAEVAIGVKTASRPGSDRLIRAAIQHAVDFKRKSVTLAHEGNVMRFTEGAFRDWGYELAKREFGAQEIEGGPWCRIPDGKPGAGIVIKDAVTNAALQQILTRPEDFDVIAAPNLSGQYLSGALVAQAGGIAPGASINCVSHCAIFEATHGSAARHAGKDVANPGSLVLSGEMMLRHIGWREAADLVLKGFSGAIESRRVTRDLARLIDGATELKCSEFSRNIIDHM